jgi:GDPmannose 4,6-dehydratase
MWLMLQQEEPSDFVVGTGKTWSVREFCDHAFKVVGLDYADHVTQDPKFFRPAEVELLVADPARATAKLGWQPGVCFPDLVKMMVEADVERYKDTQRR